MANQTLDKKYIREMIDKIIESGSSLRLAFTESGEVSYLEILPPEAPARVKITRKPDAPEQRKPTRPEEETAASRPVDPTSLRRATDYIVQPQGMGHYRMMPQDEDD